MRYVSIFRRKLSVHCYRSQSRQGARGEGIRNACCASAAPGSDTVRCANRCRCAVGAFGGRRVERIDDTRCDGVGHALGSDRHFIDRRGDRMWLLFHLLDSPCATVTLLSAARELLSCERGAIDWQTGCDAANASRRSSGDDDGECGLRRCAGCRQVRQKSNREEQNSDNKACCGHCRGAGYWRRSRELLPSGIGADRATGPVSIGAAIRGATRRAGCVQDRRIVRRRQPHGGLDAKPRRIMRSGRVERTATSRRRCWPPGSRAR